MQQLFDDCKGMAGKILSMLKKIVGWGVLKVVQLS
jgi:hypothetical protein